MRAVGRPAVNRAAILPMARAAQRAAPRAKAFFADPAAVAVAAPAALLARQAVAKAAAVRLVRWAVVKLAEVRLVQRAVVKLVAARLVRWAAVKLAGVRPVQWAVVKLVAARPVQRVAAKRAAVLPERWAKPEVRVARPGVEDNPAPDLMAWVARKVAPAVRVDPQVAAVIRMRVLLEAVEAAMQARADRPALAAVARGP